MEMMVFLVFFLGLACVPASHSESSIKDFDLGAVSLSATGDLVKQAALNTKYLLLLQPDRKNQRQTHCRPGGLDLTLC
jgi:hypothetical protein